MNTTHQLALKALLDGIVEGVKAAGPLGAPAGPIYATLMQFGATLETFETIMETLVGLGKLSKKGDLYFCPAV